MNKSNVVINNCKLNLDVWAIYNRNTSLSNNLYEQLKEKLNNAVPRANSPVLHPVSQENCNYKKT